jgi:hypothetical protein
MSVTQQATSLSRTSTPARAITSPLSTRSSLPIPPATYTFEPRVKAVLRHRLLYNIFGYSLVFSWIQTVAWVTWSAGGVSELGVGGLLVTPVLPMTLVLTGLSWAVGSLPVIVLRKKYLTGDISHGGLCCLKTNHSSSDSHFSFFAVQNIATCTLKDQYSSRHHYIYSHGHAHHNLTHLDGIHL